MTQSKLILHETFETEYIEYIIFPNSVDILKKKHLMQQKLEDCWILKITSWRFICILYFI